jgi:hypothetical protein
MLKQGLMAAALALGTVSAAVPATAQLTQKGGLVNVTVGDVILRDILTDIEINVS